MTCVNTTIDGRRRVVTEMGGNGSFPVRITARQRTWWAVIGIVAFAFLSLRPACDIWMSHWTKHDSPPHPDVHVAVAHEVVAHASHDEPCCAKIKGSALVKPTDTIVSRGERAKAPAYVVFVRTAPRVAMSLLRSLGASVIPPGNLPFYERSARILR